MTRHDAQRPRALAIIGTGKVARHHAAAAAALGHGVVAGSATSPESPRWKAFKEVAPGADFVADGKRLLDDPEIDAVVACLPWHVLPDWAPRLLACDKAVLIEKPIALSAAQAEAALSQAGARSGNKLVGYNRRYYDVVARLRRRLGEGGLKAAQVTVSEDLARQVRDHGPDIVPHILAFSSHLLDLALHLLGPLRVVRLYGHAERHAPGFTSLNGLLETTAGIPVALALNADDPSPAGLRCLFDDRTTWHLSPLERLCVYDRYEIVESTHDSRIRRYVPHAAETRDEPADFKPGFLAQTRAFLSGRFGPGARPEECLELHRFIDTVQAAA